jgi:hypothetical protein
MSKTEIKVHNPRISSYKVPRETWLLAILIGIAATSLRFISNDKLHQAAQLTLFVVFAINAFNFIIPFIAPNSVLGGAKFKALVLAAVALIGLTSFH